MKHKVAGRRDGMELAWIIGPYRFAVEGYAAMLRFYHIAINLFAVARHIAQNEAGRLLIKAGIGSHAFYFERQWEVFVVGEGEPAIFDIWCHCKTEREVAIVVVFAVNELRVAFRGEGGRENYYLSLLLIIGRELHCFKAS